MQIVNQALDALFRAPAYLLRGHVPLALLIIWAMLYMRTWFLLDA